MSKRTCALLTIGIAVLLTAVTALAGVTPSRLNYQGLLTDANGRPLNQTSVQMTFRIWDHPVLAAPENLKWEETLLVSVVDGLFNVILGDNIPIDAAVFDSSASYLGIQIGSDPEGSPRTRLVSVGYSTRVETLDGARGGVISGTVSLEPAASTRDGVATDLRFEIFDALGEVKYWASETEVFTPCLQFAGDDSRQCTAAMSSGTAQSDASGEPSTINNLPTILAEQSINCPSDGYVLVLGSCEAKLDLTDVTIDSDSRIVRTYSAEFGVAANSAELPADQQKNWMIKAIDPFRVAQNVISVHKVFSVAAGTASFYFLARRTAGEVDFEASEKTLTLVFIPKAYGEISSNERGNRQVLTPATTPALQPNQGSVNRVATGNSVTEVAELRAEVAELRALLQQVVADSKKQ